MFDWLEESGWGVYLGAVLASFLAWVAWLLGVEVHGGISGRGDLRRVSSGKQKA